MKSNSFNADAELFDIDFDSDAWRRVKRLAQHRIEEERHVLESSISHDQAQNCRGAIRAWRYVLSWPERASDLRDRAPQERF